MKNKYTVVTKNIEFNIVEVLHVEAKTPNEACKKALKEIEDQLITDSGISRKEAKQEVFDNDEVICVLEGHCKRLIDGSDDMN
jgi:hypothetical protein